MNASLEARAETNAPPKAHSHASHVTGHAGRRSTSMYPLVKFAPACALWLPQRSLLLQRSWLRGLRADPCSGSDPGYSSLGAHPYSGSGPGSCNDRGSEASEPILAPTAIWAPQASQPILALAATLAPETSEPTLAPAALLVLRFWSRSLLWQRSWLLRPQSRPWLLLGSGGYRSLSNDPCFCSDLERLIDLSIMDPSFDPSNDPLVIPTIGRPVAPPLEPSSFWLEYLIPTKRAC